MSTSMFEGCAVMTTCLIIQCIVVSMLLRSLHLLERKGLARTTLSGTSVLLAFVMLTMLIGNLLQISLWAGLFFSVASSVTTLRLFTIRS